VQKHKRLKNSISGRRVFRPARLSTLK